MTPTPDRVLRRAQPREPPARILEGVGLFHAPPRVLPHVYLPPGRRGHPQGLPPHGARFSLYLSCLSLSHRVSLLFTALLCVSFCFCSVPSSLRSFMVVFFLLSARPVLFFFSSCAPCMFLCCVLTFFFFSFLCFSLLFPLFPFRPLHFSFHLSLLLFFCLSLFHPVLSR